MSVMRAGMVAACLLCSTHADAGLLKNAGRDLVAGAAESLQPVLASTLANAEARATRLEDHIGTVAGGLVDKVSAQGQERLDQVDRILEARLLQGQLVARDATDHALSGVDQLLRNTLARAEKTADKVITRLEAATSRTLQQASDLLAARVAEVGREVDGAIEKADRTLAARIAQIDEVVGRRLGNVDVIASKQRIAIEETAVRVAVLIGVVVFIVFVLRRLYAQYGQLTRQTGYRTRALLRGLGVPLLGHLFVAGLGAAVLVVLYARLPLGARAEASALVAVHRDGFADSLARFDFARARFHASQLEYLAPADAASNGALLAKTELVRDVFERPTLLATDAGIAELWKRLDDARRLAGRAPDPDLLVLEAMLRWQTGATRRDELHAASLCARALRVRPRLGGFALAPLARAYIETFVDTPYVEADQGVGRDRYALEDLRAVLEDAPQVGAEHPLAARVALLRLMRTLDGESTTAYAAMVEQHRTMLSARARHAWIAALVARAARNEYGNAVLAAWQTFDRELAAYPELARDPMVLTVFRLDDAQFTRAKWFVDHPGQDALAPLLGAAVVADRARVATPEERLAMVPPRVVWARRYRALIEGPARALFELQEANRFAAMERAAYTFEQAMIAAAQPGGTPLAAAEAAAQLGLYVRQDPLHASRVPLADVLLPPEHAASAADPRVADAKLARGIRML